MKPLWNGIFGGVVGASATAFAAILAFSLVASDGAFGLATLWLFPFSVCVGLILGSQLQGHVDWEQTRPKSLRHWFVGGAAAVILLYLTWIVISAVQEGYRLSDVKDRTFTVIVAPLVLCSFAGVVGGAVGLTIGATIHFFRQRKQ